LNLTEKRMIARREKVREMYSEDIQVSVIAEYLEVSQPTVYKDLLALGLRHKGEYSDRHKAAISRGIQKRNKKDAINYNIKKMCCVCGKPAMKKRFRKKHYCDEHLIIAGDYDPNYENKQREAAGERFASPGKTAGAW
jgi:predicted transcriptional regulator